MKGLLFSLGLLLALIGNQVYAKKFYGTKIEPTYSDCTKAIEKGVAVTIDVNGTHIFYYKDRLYTIIASPTQMECLLTLNSMKNLPV